MSEGGTELLAITSAAVEPLLMTDCSNNNIHSEDGEEGTTMENIENGDSSIPNYTIFSPLVQSSNKQPSVSLTHPSLDHTPFQETPPTSTDHTPSPLTITARESGSNFIKERREEDGLSSPTSSSDLVTPRRNLTTHPSWSTPIITPNCHDNKLVDTPGRGQVRIKISAKKLREVPSPLTATSSSSNEPQLTMGTEKMPPSPLGSNSSASSCITETPKALPGLHHPSSLQLPTTEPSASHSTDQSKVGRCLAQGIMKSSHFSSPANTTLEDSIIVSQIASTLPTQTFKERLFKQQASEKQARFKVASQSHLVRKSEQGRHEKQSRATTGINLGKFHPKRKPKFTTSHLQKEFGVGEERVWDQKKIQSPPESIGSKPQNKTKKARVDNSMSPDLTQLPVASPPLPLHLSHSKHLTSAPNDNVFLVSRTTCNQDSSSQHSTTTTTGRPRAANKTSWHHRNNKQLSHKKQFHRISSPSSSAANHTHTSNQTRVRFLPSDIPAEEQASPIDEPLLCEPTSLSSPSKHHSSLHQHNHTSTGMAAVCGEHDHDRKRLFDFEETVRLVATCAAAATAAAVTNLQKKSSIDEAKHFKAVPLGNAISHRFTSKETEPQPDYVMYTPPLSYPNIGDTMKQTNFDSKSVRDTRNNDDQIHGSDETELHSRASSGQVTEQDYPPEAEKTTTKQSSTREKNTKVFTNPLIQAHPERGFGSIEEKQSLILSKQTPLTTRCGIRSDEKTQNNNNCKNHNYSHHHQDGDEEIKHQSNGTNPTGGHPLGAGHSATSNPTERLGGSLMSSLDDCNNCGLGEIEKMLRDVQRAQRELETQSALKEVQTNWNVPLPPPPTDDPSVMDIPERRVAVYLNQLKENPYPTVTHQDGKMEPSAVSSISSASDKNQQQHVSESKSSVIPRKVGENSKASLSAPSIRTASKKGNGKVVITPKQRGSLLTKEKNIGVRNRGGSVSSRKTVVEDSTDDIGKQNKRKFTTDGGDISCKPFEGDNIFSGGPLPFWPYHHGVLGPSSAPLSSMHRYTLPQTHGQAPTVSSGHGMLVCDPSTGMPVKNDVFSEAHSAHMMHTLSLLPPAPPPPCIHIPTAIPLESPSTTPPSITKTHTVIGSSQQMKEATTQVASGVDIGLQTLQMNDATCQTSKMNDTDTRASVADACLQTSLTESDNTSHITIPIEKGSLGENRESPAPTSRHFATTVDIETENSQTVNSTPSAHGISLQGNHTGLSPSEAINGLPSVSVDTQCTVKQDISAEEMNQKITEHLESQVTQWVTQELLTRVLAAANQSHDQSCDQSTVDHSTNSCSTCTLSTLPLHTFTTAPCHPDITNIEGEGVYRNGYVSRGVVGDDVRGDMVEAMVREVIKEKVAEALMKDPQNNEEMITCPEAGVRDNTASYSEYESGDNSSSYSGHTTPLVLTPSPSPPPSSNTSPPPSPSSHDTTLHQELATPIATPPLPRRNDSTISSPTGTIPTPIETEEETSALAVEEEEDSITFDPKDNSGNDSSTSNPLSTPIPSPPPPHNQTLPSLTPPSITKDSTPQPSSLPNQQPLIFSLSESSTTISPSTVTSSVEEAHPNHSHTLTTVTNLTTDQEISVGECMVTRPSLPGVTNSLSEGEVALSPGDAGWYATYATKMSSLKGGHPPFTKPSKLSPVVAAFLDLKNSPDSVCDTSDYSRSSQSDSYVASAGEVRVKPRRGGGGGDPLDRFLANLQSTSPDTTSTPVSSASGDNTLSDMPSISADDDENNDPVSQGEATKKKSSTSRHLKGTADVKQQVAGHSIGAVERSKATPYHVKFPFKKATSVSPGEVRSNDNSKMVRGKKELSVSFAHSEGEVNPVVQMKSGTRKEKNKRSLPTLESSGSSPGELRIKLKNKTRNGIDVINISHHSPNSHSSHSGANRSPSTLSSLTPDTPPLPHPTSTTPKRLRVTGEIGPSRVLSVTSALTNSVIANSDSINEDPSNDKASRRVLEAKDTSQFANTNSQKQLGTRPPKRDYVSDNTSTFFSLPPSQELATTQAENAKSQEKHGVTALAMEEVRLNSFWDTQTPKTSSPHFHSSERAVQMEQAASSLEPNNTVQTQVLPLLSSPASRAEDTSQDIGTREHSQAQKGATDKEKTGFVLNSSHTKTQHEISIPTGAVSVEKESSLTSPAHTPTYSSDFEFSSISQPTFD